MSKEIIKEKKKNKLFEDKIKLKSDIAVEAKKVLDSSLKDLYDQSPLEVLLIQSIIELKALK